MKSKKNFAKIIFVFALAFGFAMTLEGFVLAQETGANVHIKVEATANTAGEIASGDAVWTNYSGTESSGGATIAANPGDKIYIRTKIWNSATEWTADSITGTSQTTNFGYVTTSALVDNDPDGNATTYSSPFFVGAGNALLQQAYLLGEENDVPGGGQYGTNCEGLLTSITLSNNFPQGQTVITAQGTISGYADREIHGGFLNNSGIAYAQGVDRSSMVRITVGEAAAATPATSVTTTATPTATPTATVAALPATGSSSRNKTLFIMSIGLLIAISSVFIGTLVYRIRKRA